ncbi:lysozyme inhibitor LprI family protein [Plesiomonas sp.]|uniref:lysozyme inhibitor LprI family protein n=1 Tax=Plesiomonas sp. TaxID=2486279 RepID=UPI003F2A7432
MLVFIAKPIFANDVCNKISQLASTVSCYQTEYKKNDANLNSTFRELRNAIENSPYERQSTTSYWDGFVSSQKTWIKMRDEQCLAKTNLFEHNSFESNIVLNRCLSAATNDRVLYIKNEIDFINNLP